MNKTIKVNLEDNFDLVMTCNFLAKLGYNILFKESYLFALKHLNGTTGFSLLVRNNLIYVYNGKALFDYEVSAADYLRELSCEYTDILFGDWYFYETFLIRRFRGYFLYRRVSNEIFSGKTTKTYFPISEKDFSKRQFITNLSLIFDDYVTRFLEGMTIENYRYF